MVYRYLFLATAYIPNCCNYNIKVLYSLSKESIDHEWRSNQTITALLNQIHCYSHDTLLNHLKSAASEPIAKKAKRSHHRRFVIDTRRVRHWRLLSSNTNVQCKRPCTILSGILFDVSRYPPGLLCSVDLCTGLPTRLLISMDASLEPSHSSTEKDRK